MEERITTSLNFFLYFIIRQFIRPFISYVVGEASLKDTTIQFLAWSFSL